MVAINLDFEQIRELQGYFEEIEKRSQDLRPIEKELGDIQREELRLRFLSSPATEAGGVVYGDVYWDRLSEFYLNMVPRRRGKQIMIDTQKLRTDSTLEGSGNRSEIRGGEYTFKVNTPYADKQNTMRQFLFWNENLLEKTTQAVINYIATGSKDINSRR